MNGPWNRRRVLGALAAAALLGTLAMEVPASGAPPDAAGVEVIVGRGPVPDELPADVAFAVDHARTLTESNAADLGYAWVERATNTVVIDTVTPAGAAAAAAFVPLRGASVRRQARHVAFSQAALERIKNEAIYLTSADVPDGDLIYQTAPDEAHNRIVVTIERRSDALIAALARRYGTRAIAVRIDPDRAEPSIGRQADTSPFYGGARIVNQSGGGCSSGFSWYSGTSSKMITAGHCYPSGGWVYAGTASSANYLGNVVSGANETWTTGVGTVYMTGDATYYGDVAYIDVDPAKSSSGRIYRGGPTSTTSAPVKEMWSRRPVIGDKYCTGGVTAGEICGWGVMTVTGNFKYTNGEVVRPAITGAHYGYCVRQGDSGGPVYTVRTDGGIAAKGIISGGSDGGSDHYGDCSQVFTDIYNVYYGFPGFLKLG